MSPRAIRRAAVRQAFNQAAAAANAAANRNTTNDTNTTEPQQEQAFAAAAGAAVPNEPTTASNPEISAARLAANRANAQKSTGPLTSAGRTISSMNAVKTGLTGHTVLLPSDDTAAYQQHHQRHLAQFAPATDEESSLVHFIADTEWRLLRIVPLESSIWAVARIKLADLYPEVTDPVKREALINGEIQLTYRKDLSNIALQERRLLNQRNAAVTQLEKLQIERREKRAASFKRAFSMYKSTRSNNIPFNPAAFGFVFSIAELEHSVIQQQAEQFANGSYSELNREQYIAFLNQEKEPQAA